LQAVMMLFRVSAALSPLGDHVEDIGDAARRLAAMDCLFRAVRFFLVRHLLAALREPPPHLSRALFPFTNKRFLRPMKSPVEASLFARLLNFLPLIFLSAVTETCGVIRSPVAWGSQVFFPSYSRNLFTPFSRETWFVFLLVTH